jgi:riboflavin transporter FmnP
MESPARLVAFTCVSSTLTILLAILSFPFLMGVRIHFFQVGIILAGAIGGPISGMVTGAIGGAYIGLLRNDPTILIGNGLLGLFTGLFARRLRPAFAGMAAWFLIQAPWTYATGTFVLGVPAAVMQFILVLLTIEDAVCAVIVDFLQNHFHLGRLVFPSSSVKPP